MYSPDGCDAASADGWPRSGTGARDTPYIDADTGATAVPSRPRSAVGLVRAVLLGLRLVADDQDLQAAIRRELKKAIGPPREERRQARARGLKLDHLVERRRKLLELYYADRLSAELFAEQEARLSAQIEAVRREGEEREAEQARLSDVAARFEEVARILREMDVGRL
jgi:hypothetical protein